MDELYELIDSRIKKVQDNTSLKSLPCVIVDIYNDGYVIVQPIGSEVTYRVLNYSGTDIRRGDNALLFYTGDVLSNNGYIGASFYRPNSNSLPLFSHTGNAALHSGAAAEGFIQVERASQIACFFNAVVYGSNTTTGTISFRVHIDSRSQSFLSIDTIHPGEYKTISFNDIINVTQGVHEIYVYASGVGTVTDVESHVSGDGFRIPTTPQTPSVPFLE